MLVTLEQIAEFQKGFAFKSKDYTQSGHRIIRVTNLNKKDYRDENCLFIDESRSSEFQKYTLHYNDAVISTVGSWPSNPESVVGKVSIIPGVIDGSFLNQNAVRLRACNGCTQDYLNYSLLNGQFRKYIVGTAQGSASQASIKLEDIKKYTVYLPPIETQTKTTSILRSLDDIIELNNQITDNLQQQLRLIFHYYFLNLPHPDWPIRKMGDFLSLERGLSYKGKYLSEIEGVPMVNLGNILPNSVFRSEKLKYYTGEFGPKVIVRPGDIVVANTDLTQAREVLGSAIIIPDLGYSTIICSHHISIVKNCKISKHFIFGLLNAPVYRDRVIGFATGTTVLALPNETILNCEFCLPPDNLIHAYDSIADSFYRKQEQIRKENQRLMDLRDSLLPKLMSGELDVSEIDL